MYFLLAWFHAIVQERLRYSPLGWSKRYEFSESDLRVACDTLDTWLESVSQVRYEFTLEVIELLGYVLQNRVRFDCPVLGRTTTWENVLTVYSQLPG